MKNIHVLPTDKPSRLYFDVVTKKLLPQNKLNSNPTSFPIEKRSIHITSDEKIKKGDYFIAYSVTNKKPYISCASEYKERKEDKGKIILTTDQDLIKDGVQAIDDEFLEWFVKNQSCDRVEVDKFHGINTSIAEISAISGNDDYNWKGRSDLRDYKIIIPRKETYTERFDNKENEVVEGVFNPENWGNRYVKEETKQGTMSEALKEVISNQLQQIEELRQETLEEAKERFFNEMMSTNPIGGIRKYLNMAIEFGAKWQKQQITIDLDDAYSEGLENGKEQSKNLYSEEDMKEAFKFYAERAIVDIKYLDDDFEYFIKQFKNK